MLLALYYLAAILAAVACFAAVFFVSAIAICVIIMAYAHRDGVRELSKQGYVTPAE